MPTRMTLDPLAPTPRRALSPDLPTPLRARTPPPTPRPGSTPVEFQFEVPPSPRGVASPWRPQPSEPHQEAPPATEALADLRLAIGKGGAERSFEELRRAIMSAQQEGKQAQQPLQLAIGGPLARWLAHGPTSAPPACWHLLVLLPGCPPQEGGPAAQILQAVHKRLIKRGFAVPQKTPDSLILAQHAGQPAAVIRACPQERPEVPGALACEQLVYVLRDKTWRATGGLDVQTARHYGALGLYRAPQLTLPEGDAAPMTLQQALDALTSSWRHQQAGFSPAQPLDFADVAALHALLEQVAEANEGKAPSAATVRLVHDALLPALCAPYSHVGRQQLGLAAVALSQLGQFLACLPGAPGDHPLYAAVHNVLRSQCPPQDGSRAQALAVIEAVSGPTAPSAVLRLLLKNSRGASSQILGASILGAAGPMLRVALPALRTHLFVLDVQPHDLGALPGALTAEALAAAVLEAKPVGDSLAALLGCPALSTLVGPEELASLPQRRAWAEALGAAAEAPNPQLTHLCRARLVAAMALLHPASVDRLPHALRAAVPLDALRAALVSASTQAGEPSPGPTGDRLGAYAALFGAHLSDGQAPEALQDLSLEQQVALIGALAETGDPALALTALQRCDAALGALPGPLALQLLKTAVAHKHVLAAGLLDAIVASPEHSSKLLGQPQLFADVCKTSAHLQPLAGVLAGSGRCPPEAWAAWLQAVEAARQTAPLVTFVDQARPEHDGYRAALQKLTELVGRNADAPGIDSAEAGWRRLFARACRAGEEGTHEALALLVLEDTQERLGRTVPKFTDEEAYDLCCRVLLGLKDQRAISLALWRLRHLGNSALWLEGFVFCLQTVPPKKLWEGWGETWHAYLCAILSQTQPYLSSLDLAACNALVELAAQGFVDEKVPLSRACQAAALTAHTVLRHHRPELAMALLQHAITEPAALHHLLHHLLHGPGLELRDDYWLTVLKTMAQKVSPYVEHTDSSPHHVPLHQISFWAQWTERLIEARLQPELFEASAPEAIERNLRDCLGLLRIRHVFLPLRSDEPLLIELSARLQAPALHEVAIDYLKNLEQLQRRAVTIIPGPASELPPAALWAAVLRGRALHQDDAALARRILSDVANVRWQGEPPVMDAATPLMAIKFAAELTDVLLGDARYDHEGRHALLESMACRDLHDPTVAQRLELLHQRAISAGHDKDDAPVLMAVKHLVAESRRIGSMNKDERKQYELATAYVAHALCILQYELNRRTRARALIELIDSLGTVSPTLWFTLNYIMVDQNALPAALAEEGERCLARFRERNAHHARNPKPPALEPSVGKAIVLSHLNVACSRLGTPYLPALSLGAAVHHFMDMHITFNHSNSLVIYQDFQRALTQLCRDDRLNGGMIEALVIRLLDPTYARPNELFIDYLFEALLNAAPINACHLGVYMAVSRQAETMGPNAQRRDARTKAMLHQSNKQMVQDATAFSRALSRYKAEVAQAPERLKELTHKALTIYAGLWPDTWPSAPCEPI